MGVFGSPNRSDPDRGLLPAQITGNPLVSLSEKQKIFVNGLLHGQTQTTAARCAGYGFPKEEACRLMKMPKIRESLQYLQRKHEKAAGVSRKQVMDGMLEAIEMAKIQGDPSVMVNGWREIGRMCGFYAAEKKVVEINISAKRAIDKLETLTDAQLMELIAEDTQAIEGVFSEVLEEAQEEADAAFEDEEEEEEEEIQPEPKPEPKKRPSPYKKPEPEPEPPRYTIVKTAEGFVLQAPTDD
jgi:phage terminase small subunit